MRVNICVYSGSNIGAKPIYREAATAFGELLAAENIGLVYGGASVGLMGAAADAALAKGGRVIGVITEELKDVDVAHAELTELRIVKTMHERKAEMAELSDGFVALPGGIGTFEELFEVWTWSQLGVHSKPCALFNVGGFYDKLSEFLDHVVREEFVKQVHRNILVVEQDAVRLLAALRNVRVPVMSKWVSLDKT
jgi:uncharacterized protein (TIGR00730 family)